MIVPWTPSRAYSQNILLFHKIWSVESGGRCGISIKIFSFSCSRRESVGFYSTTILSRQVGTQVLERLGIVIANELHPLEHTVRTLATLNYWLFIVLNYTQSKKFQGDITIHAAHTAVQVLLVYLLFVYEPGIHVIYNYILFRIVNIYWVIFKHLWLLLLGGCSDTVCRLRRLFDRCTL